MFLARSPAQANQALHPSEVYELSERDKTLTCPSADHPQVIVKAKCALKMSLRLPVEVECVVCPNLVLTGQR